MGINDNIKILVEAQNLAQSPPEQEPERQYYFIKKCQQIIKKQSEKLGRPLYACTVTMGCQMNAVHGI